MNINRPYGPSLYYASDKNVFDALNQHKVDIPTIVELFNRRNIIVSKKTPREDLARYFARQVHDYQDHKEIAAKLGIATRRERITSMDVSGNINNDSIKNAADKLKQELEKAGEVVSINKSGDNFSVTVQYTTIDYKVNEFAQRQTKDGTIEFIKTDGGYIVRNTQNDYVSNLRDTLIKNLEAFTEGPINKVSISLFDVPSNRLRSKFFHEIAFNLPGFQQNDVMAVYVYKAKPEFSEEDEDDLEDSGESIETHIERVLMRGQGVSRSELLNELLDKEDYFITKISWSAREIMGAGHDYDIEATFTDPKDCANFSFILTGVYPFEDGKVSSRRRTPSKDEVDNISRVVETKARELVVKLRQEYKNILEKDLNNDE